MASPEDQLSGELIEPDVLPCYKKKSQVVSPPGNSSSSSAGPNSSPSCTTSGPRFGTSGTASRQKLYLLDQLPSTDLAISKLPKNSSIMRLFFGILLSQEDINKNANSLTLATKAAAYKAAKETAVAIKSVWRYHFGIRLIDGQETLSGGVDSSKIMIFGEKFIAEKVMALYNEWKGIERLSRRHDRAALLLEKEDIFRAKLDLPLNILKLKGEQIIFEAGITDWQEELQHLRNQLTPEQPGCCDGYDMRQMKRDKRKLKQSESKELNEQELENKKKEQEKVK